MNTSIAVIIPVFNLEKYIEETLTSVINQTSSPDEIIVIDDGSSDNSWAKIKEMKKEIKYLKALKLSKNYGHQIALFAGIKEIYSICDFSISIDADRQHDIEKFDSLIDCYDTEHEIVIAVSDRYQDSIFKKITANLFYKFLNLISSIKTEPHHADYRLLSKKAMIEVIKYDNKKIKHWDNRIVLY